MKRKNDIACGPRATNDDNNDGTPCAAIQNTTGNAGCSPVPIRAAAAFSLWLNFAISMATERHLMLGSSSEVVFASFFSPLGACDDSCLLYMDIVYTINKCKAGSVELAMDASIS